jgi:hypothetical protein
MAASEYEYLVRPERLVVHRTRSERFDSDFLTFGVRIYDFRQGVPDDQRLLSTGSREGQIASRVTSGETVGITKSVEGEHVNDFEMWFRLRPTDVVTVHYLVVNLSREIHDPQAQRDRWKRTIVAYEQGIAAGGSIASIALLPFGVVPGALTAAITGAMVTALQGIKTIIGLFGDDEPVNCDGAVLKGAFSFSGNDLHSETENLDRRAQIVNRYADEASPEDCGGTPDSEFPVSITRTAATSFVEGASPDSWHVRALTGAPSDAWHGTWGDNPELLRSRILCTIFPPPEPPSREVRLSQIRLLHLLANAEASGSDPSEIARVRQNLPELATLLESSESPGASDPQPLEELRLAEILESGAMEPGDLPGFIVLPIVPPLNVWVEERAAVGSEEVLRFAAKGAFPAVTEGSLMSDEGSFPLVEAIKLEGGAELQLYAAYSTSTSNHIEEYRLQYRRVGPDGVVLNQELRHTYHIS